MPRLLPAPPPVRTDHSNAFAHNTMAVRVPDIIAETISLNPDYPTSIKSRLSRLHDALASGSAIRPLDSESASDYLPWLHALRRQREIVEGEPTWHNAEWFFAETYAYRLLIDATRWNENRRDPFLPKKLEELHGEALWLLLDRAIQPAAGVEEQILQAVAYDLWANRIDLSYAASLEQGTKIAPEDLLVDDRALLLEYLRRSAQPGQKLHGEGTVYIVADNAGSELAMDLVLSDCLLRHVTNRVVIYLKSHPTFVSDATPEDVWMMLAEMSGRGGKIAEMAERLTDAWRAERLRFTPHLYWNSSILLRDMPSHLRGRISGARLFIIKGDANYRRAVGDCLWPVESRFADVMSYLDVPVMCLRTLKSDPLVGLPSARMESELDAADPLWRVNGKRGLIQFKAQTSKSQ